MWNFSRIFASLFALTKRTLHLNAYFMMQRAVIPSMHSDDGLQTGWSARRLRYWPAR